MKHGDKKTVAKARKELERNRHLARALGLVIVVAVAFVAGFFVRGESAFLAGLGFPVTAEEAGPASSGSPSKSTFNSVSARVSEVEDVLAANSMDHYDLDAATAQTLEAFTASTEDGYLSYYDPARSELYVKESSDGSYSGIGALFSEYNGRAYVSDVFEGSVAEAQGVQQGDFVVAIDGDSSHQWSLTETVKALSREEGSTVVVTWMRPSSLEADTGEEFTTTLECSAYSVPNVTTELAGTVGYIKLKQITQNADDLVGKAIADLTAQGATSFVLDIRDNPGGYLTQAVNIANLFVKSGVIVEVQTLDGSSTKTASGPVATEAPLVVLVNGYTSAAAEVLAAALQDNKRAQVVGTQTLGKGSVQVVRELSFGGALRYTAAYYKSPLGHDINDVGVLPDKTVAAGGDAASDAQKRLALETAESLVQG